MVNHECKIDQHTPTDDGEACSCGYFRKAAPESQPHTVHPWDRLEALKSEGKILFFTADQMPATTRVNLFYEGARWVEATASTLSEAVQAAVEKLPLGVRP